jgi:1-acyl-sn-glycerol-3-phosphate acyltransferase
MKMAFAGAEDYFFKRDNVFYCIGTILVRIIFNVYPISRDTKVKQSMRRTGKILDKGYSIAIYPEGTRTSTGRMGEFKSGIGLLAVSMNTMIVPVKIEGLYNILPKGSVWPRRGNAIVSFGKPYKAQNTSSYVEITKQIKDKVQKL